MVDIRSAAAEIRRGIKKRKIEDRRRKKPQGKNIMSASAMQGGHKNVFRIKSAKIIIRICSIIVINKCLESEQF